MCGGDTSGPGPCQIRTVPSAAAPAYTPRVTDPEAACAIQDDGTTAPRSTGLAALAAMAATAIFLAPWWNRYLGVSLSGYFPLYGRLIAEGRIPYRDFFLHVPPLQALANAALETLFGPSLLAVNLAGAVGRCLLAGVLAWWLARRFRPATAVCAAVASVWIGSGDDTEILDLYNFHALLACVASGLFATVAWSRADRSTRWWLASGLAAGLAFWTKQTVGLAATLSVPVVLLLVALRVPKERSGSARSLALFSAAWAVPALLLGGWLLRHGALAPFLQQTFVDAAASKGSPTELLRRAWHEPFRIPALMPSARIGGAMALALLLAVRAPTVPRSGGRAGRSLLLALIGALGALGAGWALVAANADTPRWIELDRLYLLKNAVIFFAHYGSLVLALLLALRAARRPLDGAERDVLLMAVTGAACSASLALSYPGGFVLALPSLAPVLAWAWDGRDRVRPFVALRAAALTLVSLAVLAGIAIHATVPFDFAQWCEPPLSRSTARSALPELRGLVMSEATRDAVDRTTRLVHAVTTPDEPILVFPVAALFYWLADRAPATFAAVHWFDVTPDRIVLSDSQRLRESPPPVIIRQWLPSPYVKIHERYFRHGEPSELRMMNIAVNNLVGEHYVRALTFTGCHNAPAYEVWIRADREARIPPR